MAEDYFIYLFYLSFDLKVFLILYSSQVIYLI